ncbi:putative pectinesterase 67-like [Capsicum annuum]|nr:putative pectinesterase 67-like [Capsicum annuum]
MYNSRSNVEGESKGTTSPLSATPTVVKSSFDASSIKGRFEFIKELVQVIHLSALLTTNRGEDYRLLYASISTFVVATFGSLERESKQTKMEVGDEAIEMVDSKDLKQESKALDKLTDHVEDRQLNSSRVQTAMASIYACKEADLQAMRMREKE